MGGLPLDLLYHCLLPPLSRVFSGISRIPYPLLPPVILSHLSTTRRLRLLPRYSAAKRNAIRQIEFCRVLDVELGRHDGTGTDERECGDGGGDALEVFLVAVLGYQ